MADLNYHDEYSPRRAFLAKDGVKKTKKVFDKGIGANPGNGCAVQMADFPEEENVFTNSSQDSKGGETGNNNVPHLIYGNYHRHARIPLQVKIYNFLERPTGWKCFAYHFTV